MFDAAMRAGYAGQQLLAASLLDEVCGKVGCSFIAGMGDNFYPCVSALHVLDVKLLWVPSLHMLCLDTAL